MANKLLKPIVLSIRKSLQPREKTLLDYREVELNRRVGQVMSDAKLALSDHEILTLLLCSIISASATLSYIIWIRYPRLRIFAFIVFLLSLVQFAGQWGGVYYLLAKMGIWHTG